MGERLDLVVIGGGPAGEKGAAQAAYFGKRVALVERAEHFGGACTNTGTIPSKTLRETCLHLSGFKQRGLPGLPPLEARGPASARDLMGRERAVVSAERQRIAANLDRHGVAAWKGSARFCGPHEVDVVDAAGRAFKRLEADTFLIAVGSSPHRPAEVPFSHPRIHDSDEILLIEEIPRSLTVVGAGVIGCEYATMFAALGLAVTVIEPRDALLPFLDREMAERLLSAMRRRLGIDVRFGSAFARALPDDDGVTCVLANGDEVRADALLYAAGRSGNTGDLGLETLGLAPNRRGLLEVDAHYRTAVPHVYAVGDVIGFPALASVSMEQARVAMAHAFRLTYKEAVSPLLPYGIYTIPETSMIGETEESAREKGFEVETGRASYGQNARGQIIGDHDGLVKLVFQRADKALVGAHVIGENASELIHVASAVMHLRGTIDAFIGMVFNYPTLSDAYKYAAYDGLGRLAGRPGPSSVTSVRS